MKTKTKTQRDAELEAFAEAAERFLAACFPRCDTAALVIEPSDGIAPVVIPLMRGAIPGCVDAASWMTFSTNHTARGC